MQKTNYYQQVLLHYKYYLQRMLETEHELPKFRFIYNIKINRHCSSGKNKYITKNKRLYSKINADLTFIKCISPESLLRNPQKILTSEPLSRSLTCRQIRPAQKKRKIVEKVSAWIYNYLNSLELNNNNKKYIMIIINSYLHCDLCMALSNTVLLKTAHWMADKLINFYIFS